MAESTFKPESKATKPSRILVIDDHTELLGTIARMLNHLGHECVSCPAPIKALDVINKEQDNIHIIITDYSMPGLSGLEIIGYCAERFPKLPVVLITGHTRKLTKISQSGRPVKNILHKPISIAALDDMLGKLL